MKPYLENIILWSYANPKKGLTLVSIIISIEVYIFYWEIS